MQGQGAPEDNLWQQVEGASFNEAEARAQFVLGLRQRGVSNTGLLSAIERVPRRLFLPAVYHQHSYEDGMLPIECGQAVLPPSHIARVLNLLEVGEEHSVLEVGTGSGYQTAILGHLADRVISLERYATLAKLASQRIAALKLYNVKVEQGDGLEGLSQYGPYDRIVLNGAVKDVPQQLISQLSEDGILIAPIGPEGEIQVLTKVSMEENVASQQGFGEVRMVSLRPKRAEHL